MKYQYFKEEEVKGLNIQFVMMLDLARSKAGIPFIITSGLRSEEHNAEVGGVGNSAHLRGLAVDLACHNASQMYKIVTGLIDAGFNRIGIYGDHIHVDCDSSLTQNVMWCM